MAIKNKLATQDFAKEVVYAPADLTPEQQAQAQKNIGLPEITSEDAGLVLSVSEQGTWELSLVTGGGEGGVQSDWNVENKTSLAYIKNKPFGETPNTWVPMLPTTEFGPFYTNKSYGLQMYERPTTFRLVIGEMYRITWDGAVYECIAQDVNVIMPGGIALGNGSAFGLIGNNEPFIVYVVNGYEGYLSLTDTAPGATHTVGIEEIGTAIHKINPKYLHAPDWSVTDKNEAGYIANRPFGETVEIIERIDWDGNTEGLTSVAGVFYKVSDSIFTDEQIKTCTILASDGFSMVVSQIWDEAVSMGFVTKDSFMLGVTAFIRKPTVFFDIAFNEPGVYFFKENDVYITSVTFSEPVEINTVKKLDNKYLEIIDSNGTSTFLQEQTLTFEYDGQEENLHTYFYGYWELNGNNTGNTDISFFNLLNDNIEVGNEYTITFDGVPYKCVAHDVAKDIEPTATVNKCIAIGNYSETLNNGEPFTIILWDITGSDIVKFGYISVKNAEKLDSVQHTISISKAGKVRIKPEYLYQPDWNQTDGTQPDFIKNKPFGEVECEIDILQSVQVDGFAYDSTYHTYMENLKVDYTLTAGETYFVTWDGNEYECVAQDVSSIVPNSVAIGNGSDWGLPNTGEPFIILSTINDYGTWVTYCALTDTADGGSHTIRIHRIDVLTKKIDPKYLPDNIGDDSGPSLPEVTTEDAGKFLRVSADGAWVAETIPNAEEVRF